MASANADHTETVTKTASASSEATADSTGVAERKACVSIDEVKKDLGLENVEHVGAVLAQKIIDRANEMAFERASKFCIEDAKKNGWLKRRRKLWQRWQPKGTQKQRLPQMPLQPLRL